MLIPQSNADKIAFVEKTGAKSLFPLDCFLGISSLPFKITPAAMLKIAFWAQSQFSYQRTEDIIKETMGISINDDTIRHVTNYVGNVIFHNDNLRTIEAIHLLNTGNIDLSQTQRGVLYIQAESFEFHSRTNNDIRTNWHKNLIGEVFSSNDIRCWLDEKGNQKKTLLRKEYISCVGAVSEFKEHLFCCALRNGYGKFQDTVVLSDGSAWFKDMVDEMFPNAQLILDYFFLSEKVHSLAALILPEEEAISWAKSACEQLKNGKYVEILSTLQYNKNCMNNIATINLIKYISYHIDNIDYPNYISKGYLISNKEIEHDQKQTLHDRINRACIQWNMNSAQAILTLKTKAESNLWYEDVEKPFLDYCWQLSL
jgi:hypothetical protein